MISWLKGTAMAAHTDDPTMKPADLVAAVFDGAERNEFEIVADGLSAQVKAGLAAPTDALYPELLAPR